MSVPYTYFLYHKPTGLKYYGVKFSKRSNPKLFWVPGGYYSSSVKVKKLIEQYGADSFRAEIRKTFACAEDAVRYEYKFLRKVNAVSKNDWLNQCAVSDKFYCIMGEEARKVSSERMKKQMKNFKPSAESNQKRSKTLIGKVITAETRKKMSEVQKNRSEEKEQARRDKIRKHAIGRGHSDEVKQALSNIVSQTRWVNNGTEQKKVHVSELEAVLSDGWKNGRILTVVSCPHCGATGVKHNIVRRHFDRCKNKENI
jgi:hypothetical protein